MRVIIYNRVSTKDQTTEQQTVACENYAKARGWEVLETVVEVATTKQTRPLKEEVKKRLLRREADGLVVFRMDRWARTTVEMINDIEALEKAGVLVASLHETIDTSSAMGRAMVQLIGVFAQLERDLHAEATKDRLAALKHMGVVLGRPKKIDDQKILDYAKANPTMSQRDIARELNVSLGTVNRILRPKQSPKTPLGTKNPPPNDVQKRGAGKTR